MCKGVCCLRVFLRGKVQKETSTEHLGWVPLSSPTPIHTTWVETIDESSRRALKFSLPSDGLGFARPKGWVGGTLPKTGGSPTLTS